MSIRTIHSPIGNSTQNRNRHTLIAVLSHHVTSSCENALSIEISKTPNLSLTECIATSLYKGKPGLIRSFFLSIIQMSYDAGFSPFFYLNVLKRRLAF